MDRLIETQMANIEKAYESIPMGGKLEFSKSAMEGIHQVLRELKEYKDLEENGLFIKLPFKKENEMKRLTCINKDGEICRTNCEISDFDAWKKLAEYEELEEQGTIVKIPCPNERRSENI